MEKKRSIMVIILIGLLIGGSATTSIPLKNLVCETHKKPLVKEKVIGIVGLPGEELVAKMKELPHAPVYLEGCRGISRSHWVYVCPDCKTEWRKWEDSTSPAPK